MAIRTAREEMKSSSINNMNELAKSVQESNESLVNTMTTLGDINSQLLKTLEYVSSMLKIKDTELKKEKEILENKVKEKEKEDSYNRRFNKRLEEVTKIKDIDKKISDVEKSSKINDLSKWLKTGDNVSNFFAKDKEYRDKVKKAKSEITDKDTLEKVLGKLDAKHKAETDELRLSTLTGDGKETFLTKMVDGIGGMSDKLSGITSIVSTGIGLLGKLSDALSGAIEEALGAMSKHMGSMDARLQGATALDGQAMTYKKISDNLNSTLAINPYISQIKLLDKISDLTEKGIAYNLEERAYIASLTDKMVPTFDALNTSLLSMIRLQQQDLTMAQMGAEARLLKTLNANYQDTSYLNNQYDAVYSGITDALSTMSGSSGVEFNYALQKWLGALYSVGLSDAAVNTIAQGINALGSGNISALNSNSGLQTLMAMSAQSAGLGYSTLLTQGLSAKDVNELMRAMVNYLKQIADSTTNQVTKSQWASILNLSSIANLKAFQNLSVSDINALYEDVITYQNAYAEFGEQQKNLSKRYTLEDMYNNILENIMFTFGNNIVDNPLQYGTYKAYQLLGPGSSLDPILSLIPGFEFVQKGLAVLNAVNMGVGLIKSLADIADSLTSFTEAEKLSFGGFKISAYTRRGDFIYGNAEEMTPKTFDKLVTGISESTSFKSSVQTATADAVNQTLEQRAESYASTYENVASGMSTTKKDINDLYSELFERQTSPIKVYISDFSDDAQFKIHQGVNADDIAAIKEHLTGEQSSQSLSENTSEDVVKDMTNQLTESRTSNILNSYMYSDLHLV